MEIVIRPFRAEDMDGLYFLDRNCHRPESQIAYGRMLSTLLEKEVSCVVAAEPTEGQPARLVGAVVLRSEPERSQLQLLVFMVHPALRRLGLARKLIDWVQRIGEVCEFRELALARHSDDPESGAALERLGFRLGESTAPAYRHGKEAPLWIFPIETPAGRAARESEAS